MRIVNFRVKNFRSIKDSGGIENITKIFALIGRNNSGKSSFLKALQVLLGKRDVDIEDFHKNTDEPIEISGTLTKGFGAGASRVNLKIICTREDLKGTCYIDDTEVTKAKFNKEHPELLCIDDIRNPAESQSGGQKTTLLNKILKLQAATDNRGEYEALTEQIKALKAAESEAVSEKISTKFQNILSDTDMSVSISPVVEIDKGVTYNTGLLNTKIPDGKTVNILNSGTGLQSMYILALMEVWAEMAEIQDETILLVEEPEVYLHPEYQRRMFAAMRRIAENNQVIFTTHSPIMISDIWLTESVRQVRLNELGETQIENVKIENVIDELGIRYEDVLNPSLVVFVEGKNDIRFFEHLGVKDPKLKVIYTDGFRAIHYFAFIKIISSEHVSNNFVLIADSDGENPTTRAQGLEDEIYVQFQTPTDGLREKIQGNIFILNEYAIESYFLTEATLSGAFPEIEAGQWGSFISEYKDKYAEKQAEVTAGIFSIDEFRKYLKPKLVFESIKIPAFDTAYRNFWSDKPSFLATRDLVAQRCESIGASGGDWFGHTLGFTDLEAVPELAAMKKTILGKLGT